MTLSEQGFNQFPQIETLCLKYTESEESPVRFALALLCDIYQDRKAGQDYIKVIYLFSL